MRGFCPHMYTCSPLSRVLQMITWVLYEWFLMSSMVCLFSFCSTQIVCSSREILQFISALFLPASVPPVHHFPRKEISSPIAHQILQSHSKHYPEFQKPPFPTSFLTDLKKNLYLVAFSLPVILSIRV